MQSRFSHHCDNCTFLGIHGKFDLYYCETAKPLPTVILRYGDHGSDYNSGMVFAEKFYRQFCDNLSVIDQEPIDMEKAFAKAYVLAGKT